ncbi:MAG: alpha mannosidase-like protein [Geoglossum umbratile]|nr:MAG: alpha mannosidase-like protein [Geoglossum umbratile]
MTRGQIAALRQEAVELFYHGYSNYMEVAFPEDELRPVSCAPLTRDTLVPANIGLNDALGNYSLTLIDSLSTLAILASSPQNLQGKKNTALRDFQEGVELLVGNYGDGTEGRSGAGLRARGFDVDSKVQVFETVIRGVGGLLSAHLFAVGELPIKGYDLGNLTEGSETNTRFREIKWPSGFVYSGQLLRLAHDLASRLLPAFWTPTGIPYPRVNLRHGIPFYPNSAYHDRARQSQCGTTRKDTLEIIETCSAGAGSLVLEFTALSRLTGDGRFEELGKRAFWAVWNRRSSIGLIGNGLDPESGLWVGPVTGIGAGVDSFFEYALKSHILLSGLPPPNNTKTPFWKTRSDPLDDPNRQFTPLSPEEHSADSFLTTWQEAHAAIKRHMYNDYHHPHYVNVHISTGAPLAFWVDSLGAYYPGLLTLGGELDEAIETSLLYTALWTRYSALPERWSTRDGGVEGSLGWWPGRPEFIESNYHLYRATRDPWYLYVGEMVLRDIKRRCWTSCGLSGIQDVRSGELSDRMESFFLGETAKYLFLLFDPDHPINTLDAPFVFTTEGHPLVIPRSRSRQCQRDKTVASEPNTGHGAEACPPPPPPIPFTLSATAARPDIFHAASLTRLHLIPNLNTIASPLVEYTTDHPSITLSDLHSPTNYTFYPWTLPPTLIPPRGISSKLTNLSVFELHFPIHLGDSSQHGQDGVSTFGGGIYRIADGLVVKSLEGVRIGLVHDQPRDGATKPLYRINRISGIFLGRDEKVYIPKSLLGASDPNFRLSRDPSLVDLVLDMPPDPDDDYGGEHEDAPPVSNGDTILSDYHDNSGRDPALLQPLRQGERFFPSEDIRFEPSDSTKDMKLKLNLLVQRLSSLLRSPPQPGTNTQPKNTKKTKSRTTTPIYLAALSSSGLGSAPLPDPPTTPYTTLFLAPHPCAPLAPHIPQKHQLLVFPRGKCSFSQKLSTIPSFPPSPSSLQLAIVVSYPEHEDPSKRDMGEAALPQPLLDVKQHTPNGMIRHNPIPLVLVGGGEETWELLRRAKGVRIERRWSVHVQGILVGNLEVI